MNSCYDWFAMCCIIFLHGKGNVSTCPQEILYNKVLLQSGFQYSILSAIRKVILISDFLLWYTEQYRFLDSYISMYRKFKEMGDTQETEPQTIIGRVSEIPVVASAYSVLSEYYTWAKDYNTLTKATLGTAESSIKFAAEQAKPVVSKLEKPIALADSAACKTLDMIQEKCPIITKTPEEIAKETKEMYKTTLQPTVERVTSVKEYGMETVNAAKDYGYQKASEFMSTSYGQMLGTSVTKTLTVADQYVDYYLPPSAEEKSEEVNLKPLSNDVMFARVSKLSNKLKNRVQRLTVRQIEQAQKRTQDTLVHLHIVLDLVQTAKSSLNSTNMAMKDRVAAAQVKASALWEELNKDLPANITKDEIVAMTLEQKSVFFAQVVTKELQNAYNNASQKLPAVPDTLKPAFVQTQKYVKELYNQIGEIKNVNDATTLVVGQIRESSKLLQDAIAQLLDRTSKLQPMEWLFTEITIGDICLEDDISDISARLDDEDEERTRYFYRHRPSWMD